MKGVRHILIPSPDVPQADEWQQAPDGDVPRKRLAQRLDKQEQFEQVKDVQSRGLSPKEIAQQLNMPVRKVYRWQEREMCPTGGSQRASRSDKQRRFKQIKDLQLRGLSQKEIAERL